MRRSSPSRRVPGLKSNAGVPSAFLVVPVLVAAVAFGCSRSSGADQAGTLTAVEVLGPMPVPTGNPQTAEKAELGKMLFFDPRLAANGQMACSTCHLPEKGFSDGLARNKDHKGEELPRNSTSLWNSGYEDFPSWDGSMATLEQHSGRALTRFGENIPALIAKIDAIPGYRDRFRKIFGEVNFTNVIRALAAFERTLISWRSDHDLFEAGDKSALTAPEQRGRELFFGKAGCATCHAPPFFTDNRFHALGVPQVGPKADDPGRFTVTGDERERGAFRTPTLRNVALTAPYMHDGALATLEEVVAFYEGGGGAVPGKSPLIQPFTLGAGERAALVAYLEALTHEGVKVRPPQLP
jgi:cytochrome c peroxidase